jgi:putative transposase
MIRTYKRKLILTKRQSNRIASWIGACRVLYNLGMEIKISAYKSTGKSVNSYSLINQLPELKKEYDWIKDVPAQTLQSSLERLENSYENFFRNFKKGGGYPKFATKRKYKSIIFKQNTQNRVAAIRVKNNKIRLPKIGFLKMFKDSEIKGDIKTVTIKIEPTGFFICIQCDNVPTKFDSENQTIGLDMGLSHFCVDSNGFFIENPKHFAKHERRLRIENRSLARKKKGSNSWNKQAKKLALLHHKIGNIRKDFLHKESTKIAKSNSMVYIENLNIKGMAKNGKLAKHILDAGWGIFGQMLSYKTKVEKVNAAYTSQQCNNCGHIAKENRKNQSKFECVICGHKVNADINASENIKSKGITLSRERSSVEQALALESINTGMSATS